MFIVAERAGTKKSTQPTNYSGNNVFLFGIVTGKRLDETSTTEPEMGGN